MSTPKFQAALESRERYSRKVDVARFFTHTGDPLPSVSVVIPRKGDEMRAIASAYNEAATIAKGAGNAAEDCKRDGDLVNELKTICVLWEAYRDADNPAAPAFIDPVWMRDNLDSDQLGCLLRTLEEVRKHRGPLPWEFDAETVEAVRDRCVALYDSDVPEVALANMDHTYLTSFVVFAMKQWADERAAFLRRLGETEPHVETEDVDATGEGSE
jgi:hypothetical protein